MTPEELARNMQNERYGQNYLPPNDIQWEYLNDYDRGVLIQIAGKVLHEHGCEDYPCLRQLALDLKQHLR